MPDAKPRCLRCGAASEWIAGERFVAPTISKMPVVKCERVFVDDGTGLLQFWCPFCRRYHVHGGGKNPGDGDGHRAAHCHERSSPFLASGYILKEIRKRARGKKEKG